MPDFVQAQHDKKTMTNFFPTTYAAWAKEFPIDPPTDEEVEKAQGATRKDKESRALSVKTKQMEKVRNSSSLLLSHRLTRYVQRVFSWFHNHTRATTAGTGKRSILKIGKPKLLQPWQAYQTLHNDAKTKDEINDRYKAYLKNLTEGEKAQGRFAFTNAYMKECYNNATDEVKKRVEEHRQGLRMKPEPVDTDSREERNCSLQK